MESLPKALRDEARTWLEARGLALRQRGAPLGVCIMTADFWGLPSAGGTATAYHLLAQVCVWAVSHQSMVVACPAHGSAWALLAWHAAV